MSYDLQQYYALQSNASFWSRPKSIELSRKAKSLHKNADAARRILYDSGFSYDGPLPVGALEGDPQFTRFYATTGSITRHSITTAWLEHDVKNRGYDCTGHRHRNLYLQALAGNKKAREELDAAYGRAFPSHPKEAWFAIEQIMHGAYESYLKEYKCPNRLCNHPMYPAIPPPLPNPVKLRGFILRARKARDTGTLSWMLGRDVELNELRNENAEDLVRVILNRFGYSSAEIAAMNSIISEQEKVTGQTKKAGSIATNDFLFGCIVLFGSFALVFVVLYLIACVMKNCGTIGNIIGIVMLFGVLGFLLVLCKVFRGKKGRPP